MENNWQVEINREGNLLVKANRILDNIENLFGVRKMETGLCVYAHELSSLRAILSRIFPNATLANLEEIEQCVKEEFLEHRGLNEFRYFLDNARIPYRSYNHAA